MSIDNRSKKRLLIFVLIPLLTVVQFLTDDFILKVVAASLLVIYSAFIIFLRDSIRTEEFKVDDDYPEDTLEKGNYEDTPDTRTYDTDLGEDFKIISPNKKIEISTAGDMSGTVRSSNKNFFKPQDLKENFTRIATEKLPDDVNHDEHFNFILEKLLSVVKESYLAHSALFFWYNSRKQKLALEKYASGSTDIILQKFEIEDDILSKIVLKEEPELLTDISEKAEKDIIRYYSKIQGIKSFVGVPLYYNDQLTGVLAIDSKMADAFGIETIYSLGKFVRVISSIISLFDEKFNNTQSDQRLKTLLGVLVNDKKFDSEEELYTSLETSVKSLINWDIFTFINYSHTDNKFKTAKISNKTSLKYIGENLEVDLKNTIAGKSIVTGMPVKVDDTSTADLARYTKNEGISIDGSFLAIPLIYDDQTFGVVCFESLKKSVYTNSDVEFLKKSIKIFSYILFSFSNQKILKNLLTVDIETRLLNKDSFARNLKLELLKSEKLEVHGALALIHIDDFLDEGTLFESDPFPRVLQAIAAIIIEETDQFQIIGRLDERMFGVYFFSTTVKDAFLWAEKLRIKIARKPIAVSSKQTTFTVSIGVANTTNKTDLEEVFYNAELALNKALEKGGNTVKSI